MTITLAKSLSSYQSCTKYKISIHIDVQRVEGKNNDPEMLGECSMFDVIVAPEPCMICGVFSCVRSTRESATSITIPHGDNCATLLLL